MCYLSVSGDAWDRRPMLHRVSTGLRAVARDRPQQVSGRREGAMTECHHGAGSEWSRLQTLSVLTCLHLRGLRPYICALRPTDVASEGVRNASELTSLVVQPIAHRCQVGLSSDPARSTGAEFTAPSLGRGDGHDARARLSASSIGLQTSFALITRWMLH
jgi:hypothetical protein